MNHFYQKRYKYSQVALYGINELYLGIYVYTYSCTNDHTIAITEKKETMNLMDSSNGYWECLEQEKRGGEIM